MSKYDPLGKFLKGQTRDYVPMTFKEIERVLNSKLPPSRAHRAWWSNNPSNNVMTRQWLSAGYETEQVDVEEGKLVFRKIAPTKTVEAKSAVKPSVIGCMKGMVTFAPDFEPANPSFIDPDWSHEIGGLER